MGSDDDLDTRIETIRERLWSIARNMGPDRPDSAYAQELLGYVTDLRASLAAVTAENERLSAKVKESERIACEHREARHAASAKATQACEAAGARNAKIAELNERNQTLRASLAAVTAELNELSCYADSRVGELYVEVSGWKQRAEEAEAERDALAKQVEILAQAIRNVRPTVQTYDCQILDKALASVAAVKPT